MGNANFLLNFAGNLKLLLKFFVVVLMVFVKGMRSPTLSDFAVLVWNVTKEQARQSRGQKEKLLQTESASPGRFDDSVYVGVGDPRKLRPLDPSSPVHSEKGP